MQKLMALLVAFLLCSQVMALDESNWTSDMEAAKAQAKKEGKSLMVYFGGSDWSDGAKLIEKQILDKKEFLDPIKKDYVLVLIDQPKTKKLDDKTATQNAAIIKQYNIKGAPVIMLVTKDGNVYAYLEGFVVGETVDVYLRTFVECENGRKMSEQEMANAATSQGAEKAKHLNNALQILCESGVFANGSYFGYEKVVADIVDIDKDNVLHLKCTWDAFVALQQMEDAHKAGNLDAAHKAVDGIIEKYPHETDILQHMYLVKGYLYKQANDIQKMLDCVRKCAAADPTSDIGQQAAWALQMYEKQQQQDSQLGDPFPKGN